MEFTLSDEQKLIKWAVREFAEQEIAPIISVMEKSGEMSANLWRSMAAQGFCGINVPCAYGGTDKMGHLERLVMLEEMAAFCAAPGWLLNCHHLAQAVLLSFGTAAQKERYLPDLAAGRLTACVATTDEPGNAGCTVSARAAGTRYVLSGDLAFVTGAPVATTFLLQARAATGGSLLFIVERETAGLSTGPALPTMGLRGCPTGSLRLEEVEVPAENLLGNRGDVFPAFPRLLAATAGLGATGLLLGTMRAALKTTLDFAAKRNLYGKAITDLQAIQFRLADMYAGVAATRLTAYRACWLLERNEIAPLDLLVLQPFAGRAALSVTQHALDIHGGYGSLKDFSVERYVRDAQALHTRAFPAALSMAGTRLAAGSPD